MGKQFAQSFAQSPILPPKQPLVQPYTKTPILSFALLFALPKLKHNNNGKSLDIIAKYVQYREKSEKQQ